MMAKADTRLTEAQRDHLDRLIAARGLGMASKLLEVCPGSLKVAQLGGAVQRGTATLIGVKLAERVAAGKPDAVAAPVAEESAQSAVAGS